MTKITMKSKKNNGITLIALVITIIVLLILAGVTIATLTGENGILTRASDAAEQTEVAEEKEAIGVAYAGVLADNNGTGVSADELQEELEKNGYKATVTDNGNGTYTVKFESGREYTINADGTINGGTTGGDETETGSLPSNEYSTPYLPGSEFRQVDGTNLENGLVITDGTNYWTWIEVPTSIYTTAQSATDYEEIENDMETYTATLLSRNNYTDIWYDYYGTAYDGKNEYSQVGYITNATKYNTAKEYYGTLYTDTNGTVDETGSYVSGTTYYAKITEKLNDASGCGLTYEGYDRLKKTMLSSVYTNGGFWIGQYEAGSSEPRTSSSGLTTPIIKQDAYPYNYITCSNAQIQASQMNSGNYTSSLMFGIQWDLVLKHLETKGATSEELTSDSTEWGNYYNANFTINRGEYSENNGASFNQVQEGGYEKVLNVNVLLTTGASTERNVKMNIYDLAGNVYEWTLEKSTYADAPCAGRGGFYYSVGSVNPASNRFFDSTSISDSYFLDYSGFRPALY